MARPEKYSSHDPDKTISEIRRYRLEGYGDKEIRGFLNDIPERTYYDYVKRMYERNAELAKELRQHDIEVMREQVEIYKARANEKLRELEVISKEAEDERVRVDAIKAYDQIALNIVTIQYEKPQILGAIVDDISSKQGLSSTKTEPAK